MTAKLLFLGFLLLPTMAIAATQKTTQTDGQRHSLQSEILQETRYFDVSLPEDYHESSPDHVYPVVIVLEGQFFKMVANVVHHLGSFNRMPKAIVIGFPTGMGKDYGPKLFTNGSKFWPSSWKEVSFDGAAESFEAFFEKELFPYLAEHYRTANYRIAMGFSLTTGGFVLHQFGKTPQLFQAHIAIAAGDVLGFGHQKGETLIDTYEKQIKAGRLTKGNLYVVSADEDVVYDSQIKMNVSNLVQRMAPYQSESIRIKGEVIADEGHYAVALPGLMAAMAMIFPKKLWAPDFQTFDKKPGNPMAHIDAHYQKLSAAYGFPCLPPAQRWNSGDSLQGTGRRLLNQGRVEHAIQVLERWVAYRPHSAPAHQSLAKALAANKQMAEAISMQQKAVALAKTYDASNLGKYEKRLLEMKSEK